MASAHEIPAYVIGAACIGIGLNAFFNPAGEYARFGLPLEPPKTVGAATKNGTVSPLMIYTKSVRDLTYGLAFVALQYQRNESALTTFAGIVSVAGLVDGLVVRAYGGARKWKQWGHFFAFGAIAGWSLWRSQH